ncbi:Isoquinoline 1-oxidoreductase beta subunit [hydrothermal vent metagenome]|uniref:Isoquinoline 1-oxidoreductase beta subunit n=1 Tax=hydrothermal vent metagenome TaxID=652676 RepID=A0A3B1ANM5_9ZZZZ
MAHDFYRVGGFHSFKGGVDPEGKVTFLQDHLITFSNNGEKPVIAGAPRQPSQVFPAQLLNSFRLSQSMLPLKTRCGLLRAPGSNTTAWAVQSFLHEMAVAADIGPVVNLSGAESQCQGSVIDGFSTMLGQEITIENGRIQQSNFDTYPLLRMPDAPNVDVHFIQSDNPPTGAGEPALPPLAPAICNAIYAASGYRVRTLPLTKDGFSV